MAVDNRDVDQVSRPFQIALVAVVLLAGMWFTVLRPKSTTSSPAAPAPGVAGLSTAIDKAHGAAATSDAANSAIQSATGAAATPSGTATAKPAAAPGKAHATKAAPVVKATAKKPAAAAKAATKPATDPSLPLLAKLAKGKTIVFLFHGHGADDRAARRAVRGATRGDRHVIVASAPIGRVGDYQALTSDIEVLTAPTILVIGADRRATTLTGYVDQRNVAQAIGDARRAAAATKK